MELREAKAEAARLLADQNVVWGARQVEVWRRPLRVGRPDAEGWVWKLVPGFTTQPDPWELIAVVK